VTDDDLKRQLHVELVTGPLTDLHREPVTILEVERLGVPDSVPDKQGLQIQEPEVGRSSCKESNLKQEPK